MTSAPPAPAPPPLPSPTAAPAILIRAPSTQPPTFIAPSPTQLLGLWHVTHSSLPLWKNKRNVTVTYGPLDPLSSGTGENATLQERLDDTVSYQTLTSDKIKTIRGVDTAELDTGGDGGGIKPGVWNWRGSGFLKIAYSHWEIIGYGYGTSSFTIPSSSSSNPTPTPQDQDQHHPPTEKEWAVTYFASTIFSPAGVDIYSREKGAGASSPEVVEAVKEALLAMEDPGMRKLGEELYEVKMD